MTYVTRGYWGQLVRVVARTTDMRTGTETEVGPKQHGTGKTLIRHTTNKQFAYTINR